MVKRMIILNHSKYINVWGALTVLWSFLFNQTVKIFHSSVSFGSVHTQGHQLHKLKMTVIIAWFAIWLPFSFQSDISFLFALILAYKKCLILSLIYLFTWLLSQKSKSVRYTETLNIWIWFSYAVFQYGIFVLSSAMSYRNHAIARWERFSLLHAMENWFTLITCAGLHNVPCNV